MEIEENVVEVSGCVDLSRNPLDVLGMLGFGLQLLKVWRHWIACIPAVLFRSASCVKWTRGLCHEQVAVEHLRLIAQ